MNDTTPGINVLMAGLRSASRMSQETLILAMDMMADLRGGGIGAEEKAVAKIVEAACQAQEAWRDALQEFVRVDPDEDEGDDEHDDEDEDVLACGDHRYEVVLPPMQYEVAHPDLTHVEVVAPCGRLLGQVYGMPGRLVYDDGGGHPHVVLQLVAAPDVAAHRPVSQITEPAKGA
jgi:hypothetical protein